MAAARMAILAVALLACFSIIGAEDIALLSTTPKDVTVTATFIINGTALPTTAPCTTDGYNAGCPVLLAGQDAIRVNWTAPANVSGAGCQAQVQSCFSTFSITNRAWRKHYDEIDRDKQCGGSVGPSTNLAQGLPPNGSYLFKLPYKAPQAVDFLRVYIRCPTTNTSTQDDNGLTVEAYGQSGLYQVAPSNSTPSSIINATIGMCFVGPTLLAMFFGYEMFRRSRLPP